MTRHLCELIAVVASAAKRNVMHMQAHRVNYLGVLCNLDPTFAEIDVEFCCNLAFVFIQL